MFHNHFNILLASSDAPSVFYILNAAANADASVKANTLQMPGYQLESQIRDGLFGILGGGGSWHYFEKTVCFPTGVKKIKCLQRS